MGQKVNPIIFRITGGTFKWSSDWYSKTQSEYDLNVHEDLMIIKYLERSEISPYIAGVLIERRSSIPHITIKAQKSVAVFGKKGQSLERIHKDILYLIGKKVSISVTDVKKADLVARVIGNSISKQIRKRIAYKKAVKVAIETAMRAGASGVKVIVSGRLNGAEIARSETFREGSMPLHTIREKIDYYVTEALTVYGIIGIRVWVFVKNTSSLK